MALYSNDPYTYGLYSLACQDVGPSTHLGHRTDPLPRDPKRPWINGADTAERCYGLAVD